MSRRFNIAVVIICVLWLTLVTYHVRNDMHDSVRCVAHGGVPIQTGRYFGITCFNKATMK